MPVFLQWHTGTTAGALKLVLVAGDRQLGLYGLRSFVILNHEVQVLLEPRATLSNILAAWHVKHSSHRWVAPARSPSIIRHMENGPVRAGLAQRPEQWLWSSAWDDD
jgi:hypothetical protein